MSGSSHGGVTMRLAYGLSLMVADDRGGGRSGHVQPLHSVEAYDSSISPDNPLVLISDHGLCRTSDPDAWVSAHDESGRRTAETIAVERMALNVCRPCPVQRACLKWAVANNEQGVWGGTTTAQRKRIRKAAREQRTA